MSLLNQFLLLAQTRKSLSASGDDTPVPLLHLQMIKTKMNKNIPFICCDNRVHIELKASRLPLFLSCEN
jgi:hypothetical protein